MRVSENKNDQNSIFKKSLCYNAPVGVGDTTRNGLFENVEVMMSETITLVLRTEDAEPILRSAAYNALHIAGVNGRSTAGH